MNANESLAWNVYAELRKEIGGMQQLRARAMEFKITFVSAAIGFILARTAASESHAQLLLIPAYAAVFFDFLINSFTGAIVRNGLYSRDVLEPKLKEQFAWPAADKLWEENLSTVEHRPISSLFGSVGITILAAVPAARALLDRATVGAYEILFAVLLVLIALAAWNHLRINSARQRTLRAKKARQQATVAPQVDPAP